MIVQFERRGRRRDAAKFTAMRDRKQFTIAYSNFVSIQASPHLLEFADASEQRDDSLKGIRNINAQGRFV